jgi:hypothetical protein
MQFISDALPGLKSDAEDRHRRNRRRAEGRAIRAGRPRSVAAGLKIVWIELKGFAAKIFSEIGNAMVARP